MNYYDILGVKPTDSMQTIKKRYRELALKYHADQGGDDSIMKAINEAYETLSDPDKRRAYDESQKSGSYYRQEEQQQNYEETKTEDETENTQQESKKSANMGFPHMMGTLLRYKKILYAVGIALVAVIGVALISNITDAISNSIANLEDETEQVQTLAGVDDSNNNISGAVVQTTTGSDSNNRDFEEVATEVLAVKVEETTEAPTIPPWVPDQPPVIWVETETSVETVTLEGQILQRNDVNVYDFKLPYSARVTMEFEHGFVNSGLEHWRIQFISKNGVEAEFSSRGNITTEILSHAMYLSEGDYTVRITGRGSIFSTEKYNLKNTFEKNFGQFEFEPNNTMETATLIVFNKAIKGNILSRNDVEFYKFTVESKREIALKFTHEFVDSRNNYWAIEVISPNGGSLLKLDSRGNVMETISDKLILDTGEYYIKLTGRGSTFSNVDYTIVVLAYQE
jgi:hypothetical protein